MSTMTTFLRKFVGVMLLLWTVGYTSILAL